MSQLHTEHSKRMNPLPVIRPDGTCVSVNPTLLRLLPAFNVQRISSQVLSVPNARWRLGEGLDCDGGWMLRGRMRLLAERDS